MNPNDKKFQVEGAEDLIRAALEQLDADDTEAFSPSAPTGSAAKPDLTFSEPVEEADHPLTFSSDAGEDDEDEDEILEESLNHLHGASPSAEHEWVDLSYDPPAEPDYEEEDFSSVQEDFSSIQEDFSSEEEEEFVEEEPVSRSSASLSSATLGAAVTSERQQALELEVARLKEELENERSLRLDEEEKSKEYYENYVRVSADLDNMRKRVNREKGEMRKYGHEGALRDLLPVLDNFERAMSTTLDDAPESLREGIEMIYRQFQGAIQKQGAERFDSVGQPFDYTLHEAISIEETNEVPANYVYKEFQAGYKLHERLLRPAMVVVAKPAPVTAEPEVVEEESVEDEAGQTSESLDLMATQENPMVTDEVLAAQIEANEADREVVEDTNEDEGEE